MSYLAPEPFKAPKYEASDYAFSGLSFDELPDHARSYLANVIKITSPCKVTYDHLFRGFMDLSKGLRDSLAGNDKALIKLKNEARRKSICGSLEPTPATEKENLARLQHVLGVLLPKRQTILDNFVQKWDALVWLEIEGMPAEGRPVPEQQQQYRNDSLERAFALANQSTVELDVALFQAEMQQMNLAQYAKLGIDERGHTRTRKRMWFPELYRQVCGTDESR